jgi:hypothetical protein
VGTDQWRVLVIVVIRDELSDCHSHDSAAQSYSIFVPGDCCRPEIQGRACPRCVNDIMACLRKPRSGMNGLVLTAAASCELQLTLQWMYYYDVTNEET